MQYKFLYVGHILNRNGNFNKEMNDFSFGRNLPAKLGNIEVFSEREESERRQFIVVAIENSGGLDTLTNKLPNIEDRVSKHKRDKEDIYLIREQDAKYFFDD